jgi:hypothetical protein
MLEEMQAVYETEVGQHLNMLSGEQAELIMEALDRVTESTCDTASRAAGTAASVTPGPSGP